MNQITAVKKFNQLTTVKKKLTTVHPVRTTRVPSTAPAVPTTQVNLKKKLFLCHNVTNLQSQFCHYTVTILQLYSHNTTTVHNFPIVQFQY